MTATQALADSLGWYRRHQLTAGALFWMPTSFLFLLEQYGLRSALGVQAIYYAAVVLLEVPSGWFSDQLGRVLTMRLVAVWWLIAHLLFVVSPGTVGLIGVAIAQIFLAAGYAFLSGTDVMLHFDTLEALGRADEFDDREARSRRGLLGVTAVTALIGGAVGLVDLRLPFLLSLCAAAVQFLVTLRLVEPPKADAADRPTSRSPIDFGRDLVATTRQFGERPLGWIGIYVVAQVVTVHLAAELTGPYLTEVLGSGLVEPRSAALATGATAAAVALIGAAVVPAVPKLARRIGLTATLIGAAAIPVGLLTMMAATTTALLVPLLAFRGVQGATAAVLVPRVVGGHVRQERRATFLSMTSLGGRLAYGGALVLLAAVGGVGLDRGLLLATTLSLVLFTLVVAGYPVLARGTVGLQHEHEHEHVAHTHDHTHVHRDPGDDGHHDHSHNPPFVGVHRHEHNHEPVRHSHAHTADSHHRHDHGHPHSHDSRS
ncbi:MAG: MFS transporter [Actinomycetota bacterium]